MQVRPFGWIAVLGALPITVAAQEDWRWQLSVAAGAGPHGAVAGQHVLAPAFGLGLEAAITHDPGRDVIGCMKLYFSKAGLPEERA